MTVTAAAPPADDSDALDMFLASLRYLTAADHTAMPAGQQARCLQVLEEGQSMATVARALILGAFTAAVTCHMPIRATRRTGSTAPGPG